MPTPYVPQLFRELGPDQAIRNYRQRSGDSSYSYPAKHSVRIDDMLLGSQGELRLLIPRRGNVGDLLPPPETGGVVA